MYINRKMQRCFTCSVSGVRALPLWERMYEVYQRVQRRIAKAGFVVMGLDPIGQGERISYLEEGQKNLQ